MGARLFAILTSLLLLVATPALAQTCPFGQSATGKSCSISDYTVGGAVADSDAIAICQTAGQCHASSPTVTYTQMTMGGLSSYLRTKVTGAAPITYDSASGQFGLAIDSTLSVVGGQLHVAAGGGGGSGTVTSVTCGSGLNGGTFTTSGTCSLANTSVAAGSYTNSNLTIGADGRITAASNGTGGGGIVNMTSGQIPVAATPTTINGSLALSGTTGAAKVVSTTAATPTSNDCAKFDTNGNVVDAGGPCTTGGGGGTVSSGTQGQFATYQGAGTTTVVAGATIAGDISINGMTGAATLPTVNSTVGSFTNANITVNAKGLVTAAANGTATAAARQFTGSTVGTNTYTVTTIEGGFTVSVGKRFCGVFVTGNTGASTLSLDGSAALPIRFQVAGTTNPAVAGNIPAGAYLCLQVDPTASFWTNQSPVPGGITYLSGSPATTTVTPAQWSAAQVFVVTATGQNVTLPVVTGLDANAGLIIQTSPTVTATLTPNAADGINGGAIGTAITIPSGSTLLVTTSGTSGTGALSAPVGLANAPPITWLPGQNLAAVATGVTMSPSRPGLHFISAINCRIDVAVGGTATLDVYMAPSGTAFSSGTKINSVSCNANGTANTEQTVTMTTSPTIIPVGNAVGFVAAGAGWASSAGAGALQLNVY